MTHGAIRNVLGPRVRSRLRRSAVGARSRSPPDDASNRRRQPIGQRSSMRREPALSSADLRPGWSGSGWNCGRRPWRLSRAPNRPESNLACREGPAGPYCRHASPRSALGPRLMNVARGAAAPTPEFAPKPHRTRTEPPKSGFRPPLSSTPAPKRYTIHGSVPRETSRAPTVISRA